MKNGGFTFVLLGICLVTLSACRSPQQVARREVEQELAARRVEHEESMRHYEQARKALNDGKMNDAQQELTLSVQKDDGNIYAWMLLGQVQFDLNQPFESADAFNHAARLEPSRYEPHFNLGIVLESMGKFPQAIAAYETAFDLSSGQLDITENLARAYVRSGRNLDRARELIDQALILEHRPEWRQWLGLESIRLAQKPSNIAQPTTEAAER